MITIVAVLATGAAVFWWFMCRFSIEVLLIWCIQNEMVPTDEQIHECAKFVKERTLDSIKHPLKK